MATVVIQKRKRQDRCSYPIYYKDPATGRRKYYKTFQRQKDAQQAANDLRALLDTGKMSEIDKSKARLNLQSFEEVGKSLKTDWENREKRSELSIKTVEGYCYWLKYTEKMFGEKFKKSKTPLVPNDHPESDDSELADEKDIKLMQSMIEQLQ